MFCELSSQARSPRPFGHWSTNENRILRKLVGLIMVDFTLLDLLVPIFFFSFLFLYFQFLSCTWTRGIGELRNHYLVVG